MWGRGWEGRSAARTGLPPSEGWSPQAAPRAPSSAGLYPPPQERHLPSAPGSAWDPGCGPRRGAVTPGAGWPHHPHRGLCGQLPSPGRTSRWVSAPPAQQGPVLPSFQHEEVPCGMGLGSGPSTPTLFPTGRCPRASPPTQDWLTGPVGSAPPEVLGTWGGQSVGLPPCEVRQHPPHNSHLGRNPRRVMGWGRGGGGSGRLEGQWGTRAPPQDRQELPPVGRGLSWTPGAGRPAWLVGGSSRGDGGGGSAQVAMNAGGSLSRRQVVARAGFGNEVPVSQPPSCPLPLGRLGRGLEAVPGLGFGLWTLAVPAADTHPCVG